MLDPAAVLNRSSFLKQRGLIMRSLHMRRIGTLYMLKITPASYFFLTL